MNERFILQNVPELQCRPVSAGSIKQPAIPARSQFQIASPAGCRRSVHRLPIVNSQHLNARLKMCSQGTVTLILAAKQKIMQTAAARHLITSVLAFDLRYECASLTAGTRSNRPLRCVLRYSAKSLAPGRRRAWGVGMISTTTIYAAVTSLWSKNQQGRPSEPIV